MELKKAEIAGKNAAAVGFRSNNNRFHGNISMIPLLVRCHLTITHAVLIGVSEAEHV